MTRKAEYFVRVDSYWQNSRDWFVGPFTRREDAENAIASAESRTGSDIGRPGVSPRNVKSAVRVNEIVSRTNAVRNGMIDDDRGSNMIGRRVPANLDELHEMREAASPF